MGPREAEGRDRSDAGPLQTLLLKDRAVILTGLAGVTGLAWAYTIHASLTMAARGPMDEAMSRTMAMPAPRAWGAGDLAWTFVMWAVMMAAMMLPAATPALLMHSRVQRSRREGSPYGSTGLFAIGYLLAWTAYGGIATGCQWGLHNAGLTTKMGESVSPWLGGLLLMTAGLYQWTPLKQACLRQCRTPLGFLLGRWREGSAGALRMGMEHGLSCIACCWFLMALLFVLGVMNLLWMAILTAVTLVEKAAPGGPAWGRAGGALFLLWGLGMVVMAAGALHLGAGVASVRRF
jgi:predicted metal-binding membrane protein